MSNISLASSTGSRVDSAAKHIIVTRLCTDFYTQFLPTAGELLDKKNDYMARRDEICLGIGRPFNPRMGFSHADNKVRDGLRCSPPRPTHTWTTPTDR